MASGEWLPQVAFDSRVRQELGALLAPYLRDGVGPEDSPATIIRQLEDIATEMRALAAPEARRSVDAINNRRRALRSFTRALNRSDLAADDMLASELWRRGWDAKKLLEGLREGLGEVGAALESIDSRLSRRRGGRRPDSQKVWLVQLTARTLAHAGVPVTHYEDGLLAKTLRILWPVVLKIQPPIELRDWFKSLKSQPE